MNRKQNLEVFAKTPVRKAVLLQIVPAVASQMVTLVYNPGGHLLCRDVERPP